MTEVALRTLDDNGTISIPLLGSGRGDRRIYTAYIYGTFGSGTVTAFLNPVSSAGTTDDIAILDNAGVAISRTAKSMFNFEAYSDGQTAVELRIILAGASSPALKVRLCDNR